MFDIEFSNVDLSSLSLTGKRTTFYLDQHANWDANGPCALQIVTVQWHSSRICRWQREIAVVPYHWAHIATANNAQVGRVSFMVGAGLPPVGSN